MNIFNLLRVTNYVVRKMHKMKFVTLLFTILIVIAGCNPQHRVNYMIEETELVPEGIDYSETNDRFYLTSIAKSKIITVDAESGAQNDFISEGEYGFMPGVGIFADDKQNRLLALSGYFRLPETKTTLFEFDLSSGELLHKYTVQDTGRHFLNDLTVAENGDVYITDTSGSAIYLLENDANKLKSWLQSEEIQYPNGITISNDSKKLYVASYTRGVRIIDLQTRQILNAADSTTNSKGIDGLEFYRGNLYAIQNGVETNGDNFRKLELNKTGDNITGISIIDSGNPELDVPLTFCIAGNKAVVIGNSNLHFLNQEDYSFDEPDSLMNTNLLIYELE